jgi:hypothetical protein
MQQKASSSSFFSVLWAEYRCLLPPLAYETFDYVIIERTREIGVMKVLGCMVGNIRSIFLMVAGYWLFRWPCRGWHQLCHSTAMNLIRRSTKRNDMAGGGGMMSVLILWTVGNGHGQRFSGSISVIRYGCRACHCFCNDDRHPFRYLACNRAMKISRWKPLNMNINQI